ncbi:FkbM family methyltransferase [Algoriphagus sp. AK58]|uniref:FkbM family methyltransferase n=1 Tax=Algoriphagus sp. AK58 TaxID=1406877 RepID=UPI0016502FD4|nr:FkbM family methyltransferase [Algoriphagus sp. AK58]MBC6367483.1 SAM-dependent methyltransferase [Algoriphagus sp. AK58]
MNKIKNLALFLIYSLIPNRLLRVIINKHFSEEKLNRSFSQEGEDLILNRLFSKKSKGFFCDVGAFHPKEFSNTYLFYLKGWNGINIDPRPGSKKLFDFYRPKDINLELGISDSDCEKLVYHMYANPLYNSFLSEPVEKVKKIDEIDIRVCTLEEVFNKYLPKNVEIDFLSIDAEGFDFSVVRSNNWSLYRPKVILIEFFNRPFDEFMNSELYKFLQSKEYSFFAKTVNTFILVSHQYQLQIFGPKV